MECGICAELYDLGVHVPRVLQCGHTFCSECLSRLRAPIICPTDRQRDGRTLADIPKNFNLIESLQLEATAAFLGDDEHSGLEVSRSDGSRGFLERQWLNPNELELQEDEVLGRGASGQVVAGTYAGRPVAVKLVDLSGLQPHQRQCMFREAHAALLVSGECRRCCQYKGAAIKNNKFCLVMKRYSKDLAAAIQAAGPSGLPLPKLLRYAAQTLEALQELHSHNMLMLDLKPNNLLLDEPLDELVLADFGLSRVASTMLGGAKASCAGTGTPNYMAPEQHAVDSAGNPVVLTPAADVWAWACSVIHMASGQPPFSSLTPLQIAMQVCVQRTAPAIPASATLPQQLRQLLAQCLQMEPQQRPSIAAALQQLQLLQLQQAQLATQRQQQHGANVSVRASAAQPPAAATAAATAAEAAPQGSQPPAIAASPLASTGAPSAPPATPSVLQAHQAAQAVQASQVQQQQQQQRQQQGHSTLPRLGPAAASAAVPAQQASSVLASIAAAATRPAAAVPAQAARAAPATPAAAARPVSAAAASTAAAVAAGPLTQGLQLHHNNPQRAVEAHECVVAVRAGSPGDTKAAGAAAASQQPRLLGDASRNPTTAAGGAAGAAAAGVEGGAADGATPAGTFWALHPQKRTLLQVWRGLTRKQQACVVLCLVVVAAISISLGVYGTHLTARHNDSADNQVSSGGSGGGGGLSSASSGGVGGGLNTSAAQYTAQVSDWLSLLEANSSSSPAPSNPPSSSPGSVGGPPSPSPNGVGPSPTTNASSSPNNTSPGPGAPNATGTANGTAVYPWTYHTWGPLQQVPAVVIDGASSVGQRFTFLCPTDTWLAGYVARNTTIIEWLAVVCSNFERSPYFPDWGDVGSSLQYLAPIDGLTSVNASVSSFMLTFLQFPPNADNGYDKVTSAGTVWSGRTVETMACPGSGQRVVGVYGWQRFPGDVGGFPLYGLGLYCA